MTIAPYNSIYKNWGNDITTLRLLESVTLENYPTIHDVVNICRVRGFNLDEIVAVTGEYKPYHLLKIWEKRNFNCYTDSLNL